MIARGAIRRAQTELRESRQQQTHAKDLHQHRPWLLNAAAMLGLRRFLAGLPEAHGRDFDLAPRAVKQIQGQHRAADGSEEGRELGETEVEEEHLLHALGFQEGTENRLFNWRAGGEANVATALAHGDFADGAGVIIEGVDVGGAGFVVKI